MTEEKKSSGAGKFILGAAIGAVVGAIAGKFISVKNGESDDCDEECDCDDTCECDDDCKCGCKDKDEKPGIEAEIEIGLKKKSDKKAKEAEAKPDDAEDKKAATEDKKMDK